MNKIEKIRAEIERRYNYEKEMYCDTKPDGRPNDGWAESLAIMGVLEDLLSFLDTLEEEPDKSLVEEVKRYYSDNFAYISSDQPTLSILTNVARHFAEWQKEQMLKDAVEGEAEELYNDGESQCTVGVGTYFKPGERVYVLNAMEGKE